MIIINKDEPKVFAGKKVLMTKPEAMAMEAITDSVTVRRNPLVQLFHKHNMPVNQNSIEDMINQTAQAYMSNNAFKNEYNDLFMAKNSSFDPSFISEGLKGLGQIFGAVQKPDSTAQQMQFNQQLLMYAQEKEKAKQTKVIIISISVIAAIVIAVMVFKKNK